MNFKTSCRAMIYTPGLRPERVAKAVKTAADVSIIDLEDSVSPDKKKDARDLLAECLIVPNPNHVKLGIRINRICEENGVEDLLAIKRLSLHLDYIVIPKVENPNEVQMVESLLGDTHKSVKFYVVVETARGVAQVNVIAEATRRIEGLIFGAADYTRDVGAEMTWDGMLFPRVQIVNAAKSVGIEAIDAPFFNIPNLDGLLETTRLVKGLGFTGRAAIHPTQVEAINKAFEPSEALISQAKRIVASARESHGNICVVDGMMVGIPIVEAAKRILRSI